MRSLNIPSRLVRFYLPAILLLAALVSWFSLTRGHVWGDDFAGYINQSQAILSSSTQQLARENILMNQRSVIPPGPNAYPWGYPLLITPIIALTGISPLAIKTLNILFFIMGLAFVYGFAKRRLPFEYAALLTALIAFSPLFIDMNDLIQSDIPFFAVVYFVFWFAGYKKDHWTYYALVGLAIFVATFLRTTGVLLVLVLLPPLFDRIIWKNELRYLMITGSVFVGLFVAQYLIFPSGEGSYFSHFDFFSWMGLVENIQLYLSVPSRFFGSQFWAQWFYAIFAFGFLIAQKRANRGDAGVQLFFYSNLAILVLWPESQGTRFLLPLIPIFLVRGTEGYLEMAKKYPLLKNTFKYAFITLSAVFFISAVVLASRNMAADREINGPFDSYSYQAYDAVKEMTDPDDVVVFFKPRALFMFTQRASYAHDSCEGLNEGDFVLLNKKQGENLQIDPDKITQCDQVDPAPIYTNKRFALYSIN